jgi:hypothetical protein
MKLNNINRVVSIEHKIINTVDTSKVEFKANSYHNNNMKRYTRAIEFV